MEHTVIFEGTLSADTFDALRNLDGARPMQGLRHSSQWWDTVRAMVDKPVRIVVEAVDPAAKDLDARIRAKRGELDALYAARRGRAVPNSQQYWCGNCGRNAVDPHSGEDTCTSCLDNI
jgi:hypothetical protein